MLNKHQTYNKSEKGKLRKSHYQTSQKGKETRRKWYKNQAIKNYPDIFISQTGKCYYCGIDINETNISVDHKVRSSIGGTENISNIALTCWICNRAKNDMLEHEYVQWLNFVGKST